MISVRFAMVVAAALALSCGPASRPVQQETAAPVRRLDGSAISAAEIDRTVTRLMRAARVPGLALAIINGGEIVHLQGY
ncbi:MAG TPA: hypothetical protein VNO33_12265, partial [Kofleriaceae bacterium]|nr:hypothetical protein [Kofleriaceae bacterium]